MISSTALAVTTDDIAEYFPEPKGKITKSDIDIICKTSDSEANITFHEKTSQVAKDIFAKRQIGGIIKSWASIHYGSPVCSSFNIGAAVQKMQVAIGFSESEEAARPYLSNESIKAILESTMRAAKDMQEHASEDVLYDFGAGEANYDLCTEIMGDIKNPAHATCLNKMDEHLQMRRARSCRISFRAIGTRSFNQKVYESLLLADKKETARLQSEQNDRNKQINDILSNATNGAITSLMPSFSERNTVFCSEIYLTEKKNHLKYIVPSRRVNRQAS